ncbi:hypothetical protein SEUCBS140593_001513 [Sporothrix eucalyptigena]|uniref:NAD(P)-binding protein n=1 Tax=Sporothrix eucalyptigena TaxID=1812306 RepID=A0ABP0AYU6_9PEZI
MSFSAYAFRVVDCTKPFDSSSLKGKSVVITGGASGMGLATVKAFVKACAFVTFGDLSVEKGEQIAAELGQNAQFVQCDVTSFESQKKLFKAAKDSSPENSVDIVVPCAGIAPKDTVFNIEEDSDLPVAPNLLMMDVNVTGVLYSLKLARYYFLKNPSDGNRDRCFVIFSSAAGYQDLPGGPIANVLAPWFVATGLLGDDVTEHVKNQGIGFADANDAASIVLKIASDPTINGRSFAVVPRDDTAPLGYVDQDIDDYDEDSRIGKTQRIMLDTSQLTSVKQK